MGHYSKDDAWASLERIQAIAADAKKAGANVVIHPYDGPHAFMRESDPKVFHPASASAAWDRTVEFLRAQLA